MVLEYILENSGKKISTILTRKFVDKEPIKVSIDTACNYNND